LSFYRANKQCKVVRIFWAFLSILTFLSLIAGCGDDDGGGASNNTISTSSNSSVPNYIVPGQPAILEAELSVSGSQSSNAALFTLGADAEDALATITAINYPNVSGLTFTQIIPNGSDEPDCVVGLSLTNEIPTCVFKVSVEVEEGVSVDDNIEIVSNVQTVLIPIVVSGVAEGSLLLPAGVVSPTPIVAPDTTTSIKVTSQSSNTESINNLAVTYASWLSNIAIDFTGGTVSTASNDKKTVTYTENNLSKELAVGQSHTFGFTLGGTDAVTDALLEHYDELITNSSTGVITVTGANLRNPIKPTLTVSITPATITESVALSDPEDPQTVTFSNLSNSQLQITEIDDSNLPAGVSLSSMTCSIVTGDYVEPSNDVGDSCTVTLNVDTDAVPEDNKSLVITYINPKSNSFTAETTVTIGGAEVLVDLTSVELLNSGDQTTNVSITNVGDLNWLPSTLSANYEIKKQNQSIIAENISVVAPTSGTNCLLGELVSPASVCNVGIMTNADDTDIGNYVLTLVPDNNLETANTTNFSVTTSSYGSFSFQNSSDQVIANYQFDIGASPFTLILKNVGASSISDAYLTVPNKFTITDPDNGTACPTTIEDAITIAASGSCGIKLSVADAQGAGDGTYNIVANGDETTVDNNGQTLTATVSGAVLTIQSGIIIPQPNDTATITELTITNNGVNTIVWTPSTDSNDYAVTGTDTTGISVVNPVTSNPYCIDGADVAVGSSCTIGIQVASGASVDTYTITIALANSNLATAQNQNFNITSALGFFSFSPTSITIGTDSTTQPQTITLSNDGNTNITNAYIDIADELTVPINNCGSIGDTITLSIGGSCTFQIGADGSAIQGVSYNVTAKGDDATLENNNLAFVTSVDGVVVEVQEINSGEPINRPYDGTLVTEVEVTNLNEATAWVPSTDIDDYQILTEDANNISITNGITDDCLTIGNVAANSSCNISIETTTNTTKTSYTLQLLASTLGSENLPQSSNIESFSVIGSLGVFVYKNSDDEVITELALTADAAAQTITLVNLGEITITDIQTNTDAMDSNKFSLPIDNCGGQSLATDATCTFDIKLSDQAVADEVYTFSITGTNASNSPVDLAVTALAPSCEITVGYYQWPRDANLGILANAAGVAGVNASGGMSFSTAEGVFLTWLNAQNYCGYNDWEIPTVNQYGCTNGSAGECNTLALGGLLVDWDSNSQTASTYLISLGFMNLEASQYWSSTYSNTTGSGVIYNWLLYLTQANNGFIANWNGTNNSFPALPVRGTKAYITNEDLTQVTKCYVTSTGTFINCEQTGANFVQPNAITFDSEENIAYVVNQNNSTVSKCDVDESRNLDSCASTGNNFTSPNAIALYNSGSIAYVNNNNKSVTKCEVNAGTGEFANCIAMADVAGAVSYTMAVNNQENIAYIPGYSGGKVTKCSINQVTSEFESCSETGSGLSSSRGIVISTNLDMVFITSLHGDKVFKCSIEVDGDLGACTDTGATLATSPAGIALGEDESMAFISNVFDNTVTVCNVNESGNFTGCINTGTTDVDGPNGLYITQ
jgi:6-phosphogluconolactonase (cycloisomerase 2 family)